MTGAGSRLAMTNPSPYLGERLEQPCRLGIDGEPHLLHEKPFLLIGREIATARCARLAMTKTGPPHPEPRAELGFRATPCPLPLRGGEGNKVDLPDEAFDWNQALCYRIYSEEETF